MHALIGRVGAQHPPYGSTAYRYYRLHITEAKSGNYAGVAELHLPAPPVGPDFRHDFEVTHQAGTTGRAAVWALSNDLDDVKNWDDDDDEAVSVTLVGAASPTLVLTDHESAASDTSTALTTQTTYYCTVERTADTTVECRIYSDLGRTTLVDTLSVSVTSGRTWRYLVACNSYNDNEADAISFDVENLRAGDETIDYYYNTSWQVVEERKNGSSDPLAQYVWDIRYIDAPVLRWRDDNLNGDFLDSNETLYYTQDANFNVTALVNTSGTVLERTMYDPYGKPTFYDAAWANPSDSSDYANDCLFAGYRYDTETGLYHVRHRAYHPTLARWLQRDPIGYADGMSLYEYVRSRPVSTRDPAGLIDPDIAYPPRPMTERQISDMLRIVASANRPALLARLKNAVRGAIGALAPSGYDYVPTFGVDTFAKRLLSVLDKISYGEKDYGGIQTAGYQPLSKTLYLTKGAVEKGRDITQDAVHEMIHAYDHLNDITGWSFEDAEALAYTGTHLATSLVPARSIEDLIEGRQAIGEGDDLCAVIKSWWGSLWGGVQNYGSVSIKWKAWGIWETEGRPITDADVERVCTTLGLCIRCSNIVGVYNEQMAKKGIPDDRDEGKCCTLECPSELRDPFK